MKLAELTYDQFDEFAKYHPLNNYCQSSKYALVMTDNGYSYDYIGLMDDNNNIIAASLILTKKIKGNVKYGYAPKGFLVNFYDQNILSNFLNMLIEYYRKKDFVFIKFNPEIIIGETDLKRKLEITYNGNVRLIDDLKNYNVKRRVELKEFDLMMPKFYAYVNLREFDRSKLCRNFRKKIKRGLDMGMSLTLGNAKEVEVLYNFNKHKDRKPINYYRNLYNVFNRDNSIDLVFIKLNYEKYLTYVRRIYDAEMTINDNWNQIIQLDPKRKHLNRKIESDKKLESFKDKIVLATQGLKKHPEVIVAAALVIKHKNRVSIVESGYSEEFKEFNPNHLLHYMILERYKPYFGFCDLGGVSGNFEETATYNGLNVFKEKFDSKIYEYIGEFDLICNEKTFKRLIKTSFIEDEFSKGDPQQ